VGVQHLVFLARPPSRPCDLPIHLGVVPGEECKGIQITANEQTIKLVALRLFERQPRILDAIDRDVIAGQVGVVRDAGFKPLRRFGFRDGFVVLTHGSVQAAKIAAGHHLARITLRPEFVRFNRPAAVEIKQGDPGTLWSHSGQD